MAGSLGENVLKRNLNSEQSFKLFQLNCNSLRNKLPDVKCYIYSNKPEIVCFSETMYKNYEPKFGGYSCVWKHRDGPAGGLCILIRHDVSYKDVQFDLYPDGGLEIQIIEVGASNGNIKIANIYNPHKNIYKPEFEHYLNILGDKFIMAGDFNAHSPIWDIRERTNTTGRNIEEILEDRNLGCLNNINSPTYIDNRTGTSSCLDLCFASMNLRNVGEMNRGRDLGSDHFPMESTFGLTLNKDDMTSIRRWKLKRANWKKWYNELAHGNCNIGYRPLDVSMVGQ